MTKTIEIHPQQTLPAGYRYGAHVTAPGREGYYLIRESDDATAIAWHRPDYDEVEVGELAVELDELLGEAPNWRIVTLSGAGLPFTIDADGYDTRLAAEEKAREYHDGEWRVEEVR